MQLNFLSQISLQFQTTVETGTVYAVISGTIVQ